MLLQVRRIRYPITDEEDTWPGDATSSYAGTYLAMIYCSDIGAWQQVRCVLLHYQGSRARDEE